MVERSADGVNFATISKVAARGNSLIAAAYELSDERLSPGTYYYRLNQVDLDGTSSRSEMVAATLEGAVSKLSLFPNPTSRSVSVQGWTPAVSVSVTLTNSVGQNLGTLLIVDGAININSLTAGIYYLTFSTGTASQVEKLMVY